MNRPILLGLTCTATLAAALSAAPPHLTKNARASAGVTIRAIAVPAGFNYADAVAVNSSGEAVGAVGGPSGTQPLLNIAGANVLLDTLGGLYNHATAINDAGQVAGASESQPWWGFKAVRWELDGSMTVIMPITGDEHDNSYAHAINSAGQIVGQSDVPGGMWHAFLWDEKLGTIDLGTLGGSYSGANDVNDHGVVVGWTGMSNLFSAPFVWRDGVMTALPSLEDSELPGGTARALNNHGTIVGDVNGVQYGVVHAAMWDEDDNIRMLGSLGGLTSRAHDINDAGTIVGEAESATGDVHAFIYENGAMHDLNKRLPANSGWVLLSASSISDDGRIAGYGLHNGTVRSFILESRTPVAIHSMN